MNGNALAHETKAIYYNWFGDDIDREALYACAAVAGVARRGGDPVDALEKQYRERLSAGEFDAIEAAMNSISRK